jgi:hypothetical protein
MCDMCGFGLCSGFFRGHLPGGYILSSFNQNRFISSSFKTAKRNNPKITRKNVVVSGRLEQSQKKESEEKKSPSQIYLNKAQCPQPYGRAKRRHLKRSSGDNLKKSSLSRLFLANPKGSRAPATQKARGLKRSADH